MPYHIGQTHPIEATPLWAEPCPPAWYIFTLPPRGETPAAAWLARNGCDDTWYPSETAYRRQRFKPNARVPYERPVAPGYLFANVTRRPLWHVLFDRSRGKLLRVVSERGQPFAIPEAALARMAQMPARLAEIQDRQRRAMTLHKGDRAEVTIGGVDWQVDISRIHAGIAAFVVPLLGGREVEMPVDQVRKLPPLAFYE